MFEQGDSERQLFPEVDLQAEVGSAQDVDFGSFNMGWSIDLVNFEFEPVPIFLPNLDRKF